MRVVRRSSQKNWKKKWQRQEDDETNHHQADHEREEEQAVSLLLEFPPRFGNRAAILDDAIDKHESSPRPQPGENGDHRDDSDHRNAEAGNPDPARDFLKFVHHVLPLSALGGRSPRIPVKTKIESPTEIRQERRKPDHAPLLEIERLEQNLRHQVVGFAKRLEDFDFLFRAVHSTRV